MQEIEIGTVVVSLQGRDKDKIYIVKYVENGYAYLVDGRQRTLACPKKKKLKHIRKTEKIAKTVQEKLKNNEKILDSEIRKTIGNLA